VVTKERRAVQHVARSAGKIALRPINLGEVSTDYLVPECNELNVLEGEITPLEPGPLFDGRRLHLPPATLLRHRQQITQEYWKLQTTSYLDRMYYTASYSEAGRCPLGTQWRWFGHRISN
jgi:hypothetical protein